MAEAIQSSISNVFNSLYDGEEHFQTYCEVCRTERRGRRFHRIDRVTDCIVVVLPRLSYDAENERTVKDARHVDIGGDLIVTCSETEQKISYSLLGTCEHIGAANR